MNVVGEFALLLIVFNFKQNGCFKQSKKVSVYKTLKTNRGNLFTNHKPFAS